MENLISEKIDEMEIKTKKVEMRLNNYLKRNSLPIYTNPKKEKKSNKTCTRFFEALALMLLIILIIVARNFLSFDRFIY